MGYTHYWELKDTCTLDARRSFVADVRAIIKMAPVAVQFESDDPRPPVVAYNLVRFNGEGEFGYETFYFESGKWSFCKTARQLYDVVVTACLLAAKSNFGDDVRISSDGRWEDWAEGLDLFHRATERTSEFAAPPWAEKE